MKIFIALSTCILIAVFILSIVVWGIAAIRLSRRDAPLRKRLKRLKANEIKEGQPGWVNYLTEYLDACGAVIDANLRGINLNIKLICRAFLPIMGCAVLLRVITAIVLGR